MELNSIDILPNEKMENIVNNVCVGCLTNNGSFVKLGTCAHSKFLENLWSDTLDINTMAVCRLCHGMLHKIDMFKKQVEESVRRLEHAENLHNGVISIVQPNRQIYKLQHFSMQPFFVPNDMEIPIKDEPDVLDVNTDNIAESASVTLKTEELFEEEENKARLTGTNLESCIDLKGEPNIKMEFDVEDFDSDVETNVPLSVVKKEMKAKRSQTNLESNADIFGCDSGRTINKDMTDQQLWLATRTKSAVFDEKYKGKIREVFLTLEEMLTERGAGLAKLNLPYKCLDCVKGFEFEYNLQEHNKKLHNYIKGHFECEICKTFFKRDVTNRVHYLRHFTRYACEKCDKRYNTLGGVFTHYNLIHGKSTGDVINSLTVTCKDCNMTFPDNRKYRYHLSKHKGRVPCKECDKTFTNITGLKKHVLLLHKEASRCVKCELCGKTYKEKHALKAHIKVQHSAEDTSAYCQQCNSLFKTKQILRNHLRTHSAHINDRDKKFVCTECGDRFMTQGELRKHVSWVHLKTTEFRCTVCDKAFKFKNGLEIHKRFVHEKVKPPKDKICDYCGQGFASYGILQTHIRRHTGERPLKCDYCDATFAHNGALWTHRKLVHKVHPKNKK